MTSFSFIRQVPPGKTGGPGSTCKLSLVRKPCKPAAPRNHAGGESPRPKVPSEEAGETFHLLRMREALCSPVPPFDPPEAAHGERIASVCGVWEILPWSVGLCQTSQGPPWTKALQMRRVRKAFCQRLRPWSPPANPPGKEASETVEAPEKVS